MKLFNKFTSVFALLLFLSASVFAQEEMTMDEWEAEMSRLTSKKESLTKDVNSLQSEVNGLKSEKAGLQLYDDCIDELYAIVGATKADVKNFAKRVNALESKVNAKESPKADRQAELDALKSNQISALPMFFDRVHNQLQRKLDAWQEKPKEILYTVVRGDHLWGIAKKKEHYGNGFAWPMLYNANRDQIKNPDLIYPKQVFKIPNLSDEEVAKYNKIRKTYKPAPVTN